MEFSGEELSEFLLKTVDKFSDESQESRRGGRPTIADNFLLGSRNQWQVFFGECWPDTGWHFLKIRKRRGNTIEDLRKVFESVQAKPHCDRARLFLRGLPQPVTVQRLRAQRIAHNKLLYALQDMRREIPDLQRSLSEAEDALKSVDEKDRAAVEVQASPRAEVLKQHHAMISAKECECDVLEMEVRDGEAYVYCSELLDFLRSKRYAVTPLNLANALAGLPDMRWRQSLVRCSKFGADVGTQYPYAVFQLIDRVWRRMGMRLGRTPVDSFRAELLKLPKKSYLRDRLCEQWRDLRLVIEEACKAKHEPGFVPYALTSAFLRNLSRQKTSVDYVLDAQEKLTVPSK